MERSLVVQLALTLGLGLLVGLERERAGNPLGGIRTFPTIAVAGLLAGSLASTLGGWLVAAGLLALAASMGVGNLLVARQDEPLDPGMTSEVAMMVVYLAGVAVAVGRTELAIVSVGSVAVILHWKRLFHDLVGRLGQEEVRAVMRLALLGLVILPLLPDKDYGPYQVLNPFEAWLMVVMIVGISLVAYLAQRVLGERTGTLLAGLLGGLISSTATTVTYSRRSAEEPETSSGAALVVMLASTVVMARVLVEIGVVAPQQLPGLAPPLLAVGAWMGLLCAFEWWHSCELEPSTGERQPPSAFGTAVGFGALYLLVLFFSAAAKSYLGDEGLYAVAFVSGLTDVDAITLSTVRMLESDLVASATAWRVILVGTMSNLVFKLGTALALGDRALGRALLRPFGASLLAAGAVLALW